ncbi:MAG: ABC transporter permease [Lachnospiraceae bacterium]|nr:ABC transporter permease [Lachnospiraceae bacterium]
MNKGILKTTFREIKSSFGRYIAILLIIALGVGFYSGLKVSYESMVYSADRYFENNNFYDYQLLSTLGFDEDAEETLENQEGVLATEGLKSADIIIRKEDGTENVVKTMALPEKINTVLLMSGRLPEGKNECVVDADKYSEADIGKKLLIADSNEEEDRDLFAVKEFTIVGIVRSPLYAIYTRGTTALGSGSLDAFMYIMDDAYDMDYDTEVYVCFEKDTYIYSDEYEDLMDSKEKEWEGITQNVADARYQRIYEEAQEELDDADNTLAEEKADAEKELGDALKELDDGREKIADGKSKLASAKKTLADNEKTFEKKEKEYKEGLEKYNKNKKEFDKGKKQYEQAVKDYNEGYAEYEKSVAEYEAGKVAYDASEVEYQTALAQYEMGKAYLTKEEQVATEQQLATWRATLDQTKTALETAKTQLDAAKTQFSTAKATLDAEGKKIRNAEKQLKNAKKELDAGGKQIEEAKKQFASAKSKISKNEKDLADAEQELEDGQVEYDDAKAEFDEKIADAEEEIADARQELEDLEEPEIFALGRNINSGYAGFENDAAIIEGVGRVFPFFFFLVAALVCMTTMTRMVEEQRTQIGVLKALGYSNGAIIGKYVAYSGTAAIMGSIIGFFGGSWAFSIVIWNSYKMMYDMGDLRYVWNPEVIIGCTLVAVLCSTGATFFACNQELKEMAAALMRPKAPRVGKRVWLERIPFIWNRLKFLDKVSVRNLFRYKKRFLMMIIGVSGCTALLVTGMGVKDSIATIADTQYGTIALYDMVVVSEEDVSVKGVKETMRVSSKSADMQANDEVKGVNILVPEDITEVAKFMNLHTKDNGLVSMPQDNEILLSYNMAESFKVEVGDELSLQNEELRGGNVVVSGIYENYFDHFVVMNQATYQRLFEEEAELNQLYVIVEDGVDVKKVSTLFMNEEDVTSVIVSQDIKDNFSDMMASLDYVVLLVVVCAALLAFVVIYNLNNINITERIREIATIKVLGFYKEESNSYVFRENFIMTLIASLVGVVLGYLLHQFVMTQIKVDNVAFDIHVEEVSYVISVVLTLLFNQIVNWTMSGKLEKIDMAESLKSVE